MSESPTSKPQLDLPTRQDFGLPKRQAPKAWPSFVIMLLLAAVLALQVINGKLGRDVNSEDATETTATPQDDIPRKDLAARLQRNNLPGAAALVLEERLAEIDPSNREGRRKSLLTLATLLMKAGRHEEAVVRLFEAEYLGPSSEQQTIIDRKVRECMEKLGKHDELAYELADRSQNPEDRKGGASPGTKAAGRVVARIGVEPITASELDGMIAERVDLQLDSMPGLPAQQREAYRTKMLGELQSPQRRLETLQQIVAQRILYREGMERGVDRRPAVERELAKAREGLIARQMVLEELAKVSISDGDLQLFFQAEQARYVQPPGARVRIAVLESEEDARTTLATIQSEADFETVAREKSLHTPTKESGGLLADPVLAGVPVSGLESQPGIANAVLATAAGQAVAEPVAVSGGHAIAFVVEKTPGRTPTLEEAREQVLGDYARRKEMEKQQELLKQLFEKHAVTIHTEAFIDLSELGADKDQNPQAPTQTQTQTPPPATPK
jgi:foldase protein PrsA